MIPPPPVSLRLDSRLQATAATLADRFFSIFDLRKAVLDSVPATGQAHSTPVRVPI